MPEPPVQQGPRARARRHDWIDERSRALGAAVGERLRADPSLVAGALRRLDEWEARALAVGDGRILPVIREWRGFLQSSSLEGIIAFLGEDSERAARLRQSSPFAGVLPDEVRIAIFRRFETL
jgi:hypothetical protein